jgi:hypothetical protein
MMMKVSAYKWFVSVLLLLLMLLLCVCVYTAMCLHFDRGVVLLCVCCIVSVL